MEGSERKGRREKEGEERTEDKRRWGMRKETK